MTSATIEQGLEYGSWWLAFTNDLVRSSSRKLDPRVSSHLRSAADHLKQARKFAEQDQVQGEGRNDA